jgi:hypothetical protein
MPSCGQVHCNWCHRCRLQRRMCCTVCSASSWQFHGVVYCVNLKSDRFWGSAARQAVHAALALHRGQFFCTKSLPHFQYLTGSLCFASQDSAYTCHTAVQEVLGNCGMFT